MIENPVQLDDPLAALDAQADAASAIDAWLAVFARLMHLPEPVRQSIRAELREHLRERVRDLLLGGADERDAVRLAIEELGETAQLARCFEAANTPINRRRMLMHATLLLAGAGVIAAAVATFTANNPSATINAAPDPVASARYSEINAASEQAPPASFTEAKITFSSTVNLRDAVEMIAKQAKVAMTIDWGDIEAAGIDPNAPVGLSLTEVPAPEALTRLAEAAGENTFRLSMLDWRQRGEGIEFGLREHLDARDIELVTYNIASTIEIIGDQFCGSRDQAAEQICQLLTQMVEPELWRDNGGSVAHMSLVGGRLFVQAPARMQTKVKWVLDQLPREQQPQEHAQAEGEGVPLLKDIPIINHFFSAPPAEDLGVLEQRYMDARQKFESIKGRYAPGAMMYTQAAEEFRQAQQALRSAQETTDHRGPEAARQRFEQAHDAMHFARLNHKADSPEYKAAEAQLRAAEQELTQAMHEEMKLRPGAVLHLEIFELERPQEWFRTSRQVEPDGTIRFPIIGEFTAAGRTARELEQDVIASLSKTIIPDPLVSVYQLDAATLRALGEQHPATVK